MFLVGFLTFDAKPLNSNIYFKIMNFILIWISYLNLNIFVWNYMLPSKAIFRNVACKVSLKKPKKKRECNVATLVKRSRWEYPKFQVMLMMIWLTLRNEVNTDEGDYGSQFLQVKNTSNLTI